jgi:hypothetical protein
MASADVATFTAVLKEAFPKGVPKDLCYKSCPTYSILPKKRDSYGEDIKVPVRYSDPQGRSANFTQARTSQRASKHIAFKVTTVNDYATAQIDNELIDRTRGDQQSFVRAVKSETDGALRTLKMSTAGHALFRNGGGAIGRMTAASNPATDTITLREITDARFFSIGMTLATATTDGTSGAVKAGTVEVEAVNESTGEITCTAAWTAGIATAAASDYIFVAGDFGAKIKGFDAWIPESAPGATLFFNVDRSVHPTRLGGQRRDYSGRPIEEALIDIGTVMALAGAEIDVIVVNPLQWASLEKSLGSRVQYGEMGSPDSVDIGFDTIKLRTPTGKVDILADPNCQPNVAWALQLDSWTFESLGDVPKILDTDGNAMLRTGTSDAVELQAVCRSQPWCDAPGWNGRFII